MCPPAGMVHLELDLDRSAEPIEGQVSGSGSSQRFVGWLALASAIRRAVDADRDRLGAPIEEGRTSEDA